MKRFVLVFLCAVLAMTAVSCSDGEFYTGDQPNDTNKDTQITEKKEYERVNTQDFMSALGESLDEDVVLEIRYDIEKCVEVTPEGVFEATGVQFFKFNDDFSSFLIKDGEVMEACDSFGGMGFSDAIPWDYDQNGVDDLLVAGSSGSGIHRSTLTLWDMVKMESVNLSDMNIKSSFFYVNDIGLDFIDENDPSKGIVIHKINYSLEVVDEEKQIVASVPGRGENMAEIRMENGVFVYVPLTDSQKW